MSCPYPRASGVTDRSACPNPPRLTREHHAVAELRDLATVVPGRTIAYTPNEVVAQGFGASLTRRIDVSVEATHCVNKTATVSVDIAPTPCRSTTRVIPAGSAASWLSSTPVTGSRAAPTPRRDDCDHADHADRRALTAGRAPSPGPRPLLARFVKRHGRQLPGRGRHHQARQRPRLGRGSRSPAARRGTGSPEFGMSQQVTGTGYASPSPNTSQACFTRRRTTSAPAGRDSRAPARCAAPAR